MRIDMVCDDLHRYVQKHKETLNLVEKCLYRAKDNANTLRWRIQDTYTGPMRKTKDFARERDLVIVRLSDVIHEIMDAENAMGTVSRILSVWEKEAKADRGKE